MLSCSRRLYFCKSKCTLSILYDNQYFFCFSTLKRLEFKIREFYTFTPHTII